MKLLLLTLPFILSLSAFAKSLDSSGIKQITRILETIEAQGPLVDTKSPCSNNQLLQLTDSFLEDGADCSKFITDTGDYGEYGQILKTALEEKGRDSHLFADDRPGMEDSPYVCPAWKALPYEMRIRFWIWTFTSIAWDESKCEADARNPNATNGTAVGLLQLDEKRSARKWRGENCGVADIRSPEHNLRCGVDIMEELMRGKEGVYQSSGKLWGDTSYWQKLKRRPNLDNPSSVASRILEFPACSTVE